MATNPNSMVQEAVDAAISKRGEIGLQVVAYVDGKQVVDVWGGLAEITTGRQVPAPHLGRAWRSPTAASVLVICCSRSSRKAQKEH